MGRRGRVVIIIQLVLLVCVYLLVVSTSDVPNSIPDPAQEHDSNIITQASIVATTTPTESPGKPIESTSTDFSNSLDINNEVAQAKETLSISNSMLSPGPSASVVSKIPENIRSALQILYKASEKGHADALHALGELYFEGLYVPRNLTKAFEYYKAAADQGLPSAQQAVAFLYSTGYGVEENKPLALIYHDFASKGGDLDAKTVLGNKYFFGDGVIANCDVSALYYKEVAQVVAEELMETGLGWFVKNERLVEDETAQEETDIIQFWQYSADTGDSKAQVMMGVLHLKGTYGIRQDFNQALYYFQLAANQDDEAGITNLGLMYLKGYGVDKNYNTAKEFFLRAVKKGFSEAQAYLGDMYQKGLGVRPSPSEAFNLFKQSAEQKNPYGSLQLGNCYFHGIGVKQDYNMALNYFTLATQPGSMNHYSLASQCGSVISLFNLAQMFRLGLAAQKSCTNAVTLYRKVIERGPFGMLLSKAHDYYDSGDVDSALLYYEKTAELGFELGQSNAAWLYDHGFGDPIVRHKKAFELFREAAEQNNARALLKMGDYYYYGKGIDSDHEKAAAFYKAASDMHEPQATFNLGYMHQHGVGLPQDFYLAKRYFDLVSGYYPEAYLAVTLALGYLGLHYVLSGQFEFGFMELDFDTVIIIALVLVLIVVGLLRFFVGQRRAAQ